MTNFRKKLRNGVKMTVACLVVGVSVIIITQSCGSLKNQTKTDQKLAEMDREIQLAQKQAELEKIKAEQEKEKIRREMEVQSIKEEKEAREQNQGKLIKGNQRIIIPCVEQGFDKPGEYMAGLGISEGNLDQKDAILRANQAGIADIATRMVGTLKNAIDYYSKDANLPSNKKFKESELEGGIQNLCSKVVDKYANRVCGPEIFQEATGSFTAYAAYHILLKEAKDAIANEMEVMKVDYDKKKFFEAMDEGFKKDAELRKAEIEEVIK